MSYRNARRNRRPHACDPTGAWLADQVRLRRLVQSHDRSIHLAVPSRKVTHNTARTAPSDTAQQQQFAYTDHEQQNAQGPESPSNASAHCQGPTAPPNRQRASYGPLGETAALNGESAAP